MTSYHCTKLSYATSKQISSELMIPVGNLIDMDDQRFAYVFQQVCEIYEGAKQNERYLEYISNINEFVNQIGCQILHFEAESKMDFQFYQDIQTIEVKEAITVQKLLNHYLLEISRLLSLNLIPQT